MMPREAFAVAMRELGVSSDKHLVYDEGNFPRRAPGGCRARSASMSIVAGGLEGCAAMATAGAGPELPEGHLTAGSIRWRSSA